MHFVYKKIDSMEHIHLYVWDLIIECIVPK